MILVINRQLLKDTLYEKMGLNFDVLKVHFTFVTDCAAAMSTAVGSSTSTSRVGWNESWSSCVVHMLNTVMKKAMKELEKCGDEHLKAICNGWRSLKMIVAYMKRTGANSQLPLGYALEQEAETRFGTVCDVAEKIIEAAPHVHGHLDEMTEGDLAPINTVEDSVEGCFFTYLNAIVHCFKPIRHV